MIKKLLYTLGFLIWGLTAARADLYTVADIPIAAELKSANESRDAALADGQTTAFWELMKRMVSTDDLTRVPLLEAGQISDLVQNVSLSQEKNSATRYQARLSVRFKAPEIQKWLTARQIPFLTQEMPKTLLIPIFTGGEQTVLLEETNPISLYFKDNNPSTPIHEIILPMGDLNDITLAREAWDTQNPTLWQALAKTYDCAQVMLLELVQQGPRLSVRVQYLPAIEGMDDVTFDTLLPDGDVPGAMPVIWERITKVQEAQWRALKTNDLSAPTEYWIVAPFQKLAQWTALRNKLNKNTFLENWEIRGFRPNKVLAVLKYKGDAQQLGEHLAQLGLQIEPAEQDFLWYLTPLATNEIPDQTGGNR